MTGPMDPQPAPRSKRRWLRLSLRGLIVLVLILGGGLGSAIHRAHVQRDAIATIQAIPQNKVITRRCWPLPQKAAKAAPAPPLSIATANSLEAWLGLLEPDLLESAEAVHIGEVATDADLIAVGRLSTVTTVSIRSFKITDAGLAPLAQLASLEEVQLSSCVQLTGAALAHLAGSTRLKSLECVGVSIRDAGLAHLARLARLERLQLDRTATTDAGLVHLGDLVNLRHLDLGGNPVTDAGLAHLGRLTRLEDVTLPRTRVGDGAVRLLATLPALRTLDLAKTAVTDAGLSGFEPASPITHLKLDGVRGITDEGLRSIGRMGRLEVLALDQTPIHDAGLAHLAASTSLRIVGVEWTWATAAGVATLTKARPLIVVQR